MPDSRAVEHWGPPDYHSAWDRGCRL